MRAALISAISLNQKEDRLFVLDKMVLEKISTSQISKSFKAFELKSALVVNRADDDKEKRFNQSIKNITFLKFLAARRSQCLRCSEV